MFDARGERKDSPTPSPPAPTLCSAALDACWRDDRFVRAFCDNGEEFLPVGAMSSAWPALSGAAQSERGRKALEHALEELDKGDRVLLVTPPYDETSKPFPGRSADYPPGVRENGGQYSHGSSWFVDALVKLGERRKRRRRETRRRGIFARAFVVWESLSPLTKTGPEKSTSMACRRISSRRMSMTVRAMRDGAAGPGIPARRRGWCPRPTRMLGMTIEDGELKLRSDAFAKRRG